MMGLGSRTSCSRVCIPFSRLLIRSPDGLALCSSDPLFAFSLQQQPSSSLMLTSAAAADGKQSARVMQAFLSAFLRTDQPATGAFRREDRSLPLMHSHRQTSKGCGCRVSVDAGA